MIGEQLDREPDGDVDSNDYWEYMVPRPSDGGLLASFKGSDGDALVERLWLGDLAWSATGSFYCSAIIEERDDDVDGTLDRTTVLFVDRTGSVIGNWGDASGKQVERIHYDMDGVPYLIPWGDTDADGDADATDKGNINLWWAFSIYDVRGDLDLDGDVDSTDYSNHTLATGGTGALGTDNNRVGAQSLHRGITGSMALRRSLSERTGSWLQRDPLRYVDGPSTYLSLRSNLLMYSDQSGLSSLFGGAATTSPQQANPGNTWPPPKGRVFGPGEFRFPLVCPNPSEWTCPGTVSISNSASIGAFYGSYLMFYSAPEVDSSACGNCGESNACKFKFDLALDIEDSSAPTPDPRGDEGDGRFFENWHGRQLAGQPRWSDPEEGWRWRGDDPNLGSTSITGITVDATVLCGAERDFTITVTPPSGSEVQGEQGVAETSITIQLSCSMCEFAGG